MKRTTFGNVGASIVCLLAISCLQLWPYAVLAADQAALQLDWKDLVGPDWEPPIILPAPDEEHAHQVDPTSLNQSLAERVISLPGYMKPIEFNQNSVTEFLLVPYLDQHVKRHAHLDANQMVYVRLAEPLVVQNPYKPYSVTGTIRIATVATPDGPAGYTLSQAVAEPYVY